MNVLYVIYSIKGYNSLSYTKITLQWQIMIASFSCQITYLLNRKIAPINHSPFMLFRKLHLNSCCFFSIFFFLPYSCTLSPVISWHIWKLGRSGRHISISQSPKLIDHCPSIHNLKIIEINVISPWSGSWF